MSVRAPSEPSSGGHTTRSSWLSYSTRETASQVGPLEKVVYDPDFLGVGNCETLARVNGEGVAKSPVLAPLAVEDLAGIFQGTSTTSFWTSSWWSGLPSSKGPGTVTMMFCRQVSLGRYSRGTGASGKHFSWRSNSSLWARSRTFCLEVKMRSHSFQASTKRSYPRQPGSAFCTSRHWTLSG